MAKNKQLVLAFFKDEASADKAVSDLKAWDKATKSVKLGSIGVMVKDDKGKVKTHKLGSRAYGKGAGIYQALTGTASLWSTLLDWNTYPINTPPFFVVSDCEGVITSYDYNFLSNKDNCTINGTPTNDQYNAPAYSGLLADNGGPTQTISLPFDSPAVDVVPARNCIGANP